MGKHGVGKGRVSGRPDAMLYGQRPSIPTGDLDAIESLSGVNRSGMPLAANRAPAKDLEPWVGRLVASKVEADDTSHIACGICNDIAFARIIVGGRWDAQTLDGHGEFQDEALLFGPQSRHMPVGCTGPVIAIGVGFRPGAIPNLLSREMAPLIDRIEAADPFGLIANDIASDYPRGATPEQWLCTLEERMRDFIARTGPKPPDPLAAAFEYASFADPNIAPGDFAEEQGVSLRKLERMARRDFGMTPKTVLRRARALDLAAQLCGVADQEEEDELLARYFDQSHLIRDFRAFFGTTPAAFRSEPRLFLRINVETRQARRLAELKRIEPGGKPPWQGG